MTGDVNYRALARRIIRECFPYAVTFQLPEPE